MKNPENRAAFMTPDGQIITNREHEDYRNGFLYAAVVFAMVDRLGANSIIIIKIINDEIKVIPDNLKIGLDEEDIKELALDRICRRIAPNYYEFTKCIGTIKTKEKLKEKILGYKGKLSANDRIIQEQICSVIAK